MKAGNKEGKTDR